MTDQPKSSRIPGFYNLSLNERHKELASRGQLTPESLSALCGDAGINIDQAQHMIENVIGLYALPIGIALNFMINGRDVLIPMVVEEPSIVAGASFMAKLARVGGGFTASISAQPLLGNFQPYDPFSTFLRGKAYCRAILRLTSPVPSRANISLPIFLWMRCSGS